MTNEIQQTRYDNLMRRVGGIIGPGSKVSEVLTELFPTLDVERVPGELLFLSGWQLGMGGGSLIAGAGTNARFQLVNPPGSNMLVTLTSVIASSNNTGNINSTTTETLFVSAPGTETKRDTRVGVGQTVAEVRTQADATITSANFTFRQLTSVSTRLEDPNGIAVLAPGSAYEIGQVIVASTFHVGFFWRERTAEASELRF